MNDQSFCELARAVIDTEAKAIANLSDSIDDNFVKACKLIMQGTGRVVVLGMGKSGHVGGKIAATLASTGTPAFFVHPGEAGHGDLGMICADDVVIALSNSGETDEVLAILPILKRKGISLISLTGNKNSSLAKAACVNIDVRVRQEACPLGLAPTSSTTATLVMGDALAIALLQAKGFTAEDFALSHPGGTLGRRLLLHLNDVMRTGEKVPTVIETATIAEALLEMTQKQLGMTSVVDNQGKLLGIYTDGDLRRTLDRGYDVHNTPIKEVMTKHCKTVTPDILAVEAMNIMESFKITSLLVKNEDTDKAVGVVHMHDLISAGVV